MACGGCAKKRQLALRQSTGSVEPAQPPRETKIQCPACGAMHSQVEYIQCSFRLQQERQRAREMRLKAKLLKPEVEKPIGIETRRGRQIQTQFPALQTIIPVKKKW
jgi:adenine-specific DNA methylase